MTYASFGEKSEKNRKMIKPVLNRTTIQPAIVARIICLLTCSVLGFVFNRFEILSVVTLMYCFSCLSKWFFCSKNTNKTNEFTAFSMVQITLTIL